MVFSVVQIESCQLLHIYKGECICREAFGVPMHSWHETILLFFFAVTPQGLKYLFPNSVKKQERGL